MKLTLHPEAIKNFNSRANTIYSKLAPRSMETSPKNTIFNSDTHVAHEIHSEDIIGEIQYGMNDFLGNSICKYFNHDGKYIGLQGNSFCELLKLSKSFQQCKELNSKVNMDFLTMTIFNWMKGRYRNIIHQGMVEYVLEEIEKIIKTREIWIPISMLHIQASIKIGRITLKPITKVLFDKWIEIVKKRKHPDVDKVLQFFEKERKQLQGMSAATIELTAEPKYATEIAYTETEKAISLIRFFHPANFHPKLTSYCAPIGSKKLATSKILTLNEGMLVEMSESILDHSSQDWKISDVDATAMRAEGLDILDKLLEREGSLTDFQDKLLTALLLYSKNNLEKEIAVKLIYLFAALESLLLKNTNEPIVQNISERMAFLVGKTVEERESIIKNTKDVYVLRSKFIHHGHTIDNLDIMKEFMLNVWHLFNNLIQRSNTIKKSEDLFELIEKMKLS